MVGVTWTEDGYPTGTFAISLDDEPDEGHSLAGVAATDGRDRWVKEVPDGAIRAIVSSGVPVADLDDGSEKALLIEIATGDFGMSKKGGLTSRMECEQGEGGTVPVQGSVLRARQRRCVRRRRARAA